MKARLGRRGIVLLLIAGGLLAIGGGLAGATGAQGPQRPPGPAGSTNDYAKWASTDLDPLSDGSVDVSCDAGDHVVGGGFDGSSDVMDVYQSRPTGNATNPSGWHVTARN